MLPDVGTGTHHAGGWFQFINHNGMIIFAHGKIHRLAEDEIELLQIRRGNVNDIQRRKHFMPYGQAFGS